MSRLAKITKVIPCDWLDTSSGEDIEFGIKVRIDGQWHHLADGGRPAWYKTARERDDRIKLLRKQIRDAKREAKK